jgi:DNA-binding NarL/FixJ family response regulator
LEVIEITEMFYRKARTRWARIESVAGERPQCLVIDGHPLVRHGVRRALGGGFGIHESSSRGEALELIRDIGGIDVAIVDLRRRPEEEVGEPSAAAAIRALRKTDPGMGIVAHGERAERHLATAAFQAGATAYVSRWAGAEELRRAVDAALVHEQFLDPDVPRKGSRGKLTRRQREILQLLADGGSTTLAARQLDLSEETVKTHTKNAVGRLNARNRTHAVAIALRESLIE